MGLFKRKPEPDPQPDYITVEEAIKRGIIDVAAHRQARMPRCVYIDPEGNGFPNWRVYRVHKIEDYLGQPRHKKNVKFRNF